jgi:arylsulfatase
MRRNFYFIIIILIAGCAPKAAQQEQQADQRPNIILILADDMGFSDLGCYGSEVNTPNLDRLATNGMRFTQFHNTSKCFPSRASLLTGLYAHQVNMDKRNDSLKNSVTLAEVMRSAGYRTLMSGKHHGLDNPYHFGFDRYYGLRDGASNHFNPGEQRPGEPVPAHKTGGFPRKWCIDSLTIAPYTPEDPDFYTTDYFTKYALQYLEEYKNEPQPFFLYIAYTAPHDPLMAWPEDIEKYKGKYDQGYEAIRQARYEKQLSLGLLDRQEYPLSENTFKPWGELNEAEKAEEIRKMEVYAAMIDRLDQNIGKLLTKLEEIGQAENTLIFFCSDNGASAEVVGARGLNPGGTTGPIGSMERWSSLGPDWANVCNVPFRYYKNYTHEGGINTPLIAYWPDKIEPGTFSEFTGHFIDFMPTLAELGHAVYPETFEGETIPAMEGESLVPVLLGESVSRSKPIFWEWSRGKGVWVNDWKLVSDENGDWELYNMSQNKTETDNQAATNPEKVEELAERWQDWKRRMESAREELL